MRRGAGRGAAVRARRDLAIEGYLELRDAVASDGPSALAALHSRAAHLVRPRVAQWRPTWEATVAAEVERTRRQLASTLDELADRSKPQNLVDDAKGAATEKLQDRNVQMALAGVGAAVAGLIAFSVFRSKRRKNDLKELQRLLAERR